MYFNEVQIGQVNFGHSRCNLQGLSKNWKVLLVKPEFCFALSFTHVIQVKATILVLWKIGVFRQKHFVQKQEISANKISIVVKDEEKLALFKRSHTTTQKAVIYEAQQITRQSRKGGRHQNLNNVL